MTTPSTERKAGPLLGTGAQTAWPFTFKVFAATDIAVTIANSLGVETALVYGVDYNVTLNANQETSPGGTVTYPISGSPLPVGSRLVIVGNLPYDQPLDLPAGGNFSPLALENELDRLTMQIQQLREIAKRALQLPVTSAGTLSVTLPQPSANDLIGWDSGGNNLANYALSDIATAVGYGNFRYDTFTGTGAQTQFTLSVDPATLGNLDVSIAGVVQVPVTDYTLVAGKLVFSSAPPNGAVILARYGEAIPSLPGSEQISFVQAGAGAATRTVESKLREVEVSPEDFGAVGDGIADDTAALNKAFATGKHVNGNGKTYKVTGDTIIDPYATAGVGYGPSKAWFRASVCRNINFVGNVSFGTAANFLGKHLELSQIAVTGDARFSAWYTTFQGITVSGTTYINGDYPPDINWVGCYYNEFHNCDFVHVVIDQRYGPVNNNGFFYTQFETLHVKDTGNVGYGAGTQPYKDFHLNVFIGCEWFCNTGITAPDGYAYPVVIEDAANVGGINRFIGCYMETASRGFYGKGIEVENLHLSGTNVAIGGGQLGYNTPFSGEGGQIQRDVPHIYPAGSMLVGGDWSILDTSGKPYCLGSNGHTVTLGTDSQEPTGLSKYVQFAATGAFSTVSINFGAADSNNRTLRSFSVVYKVTAGDVAWETQDASGSIVYGAENIVRLGNGWVMVSGHTFGLARMTSGSTYTVRVSAVSAGRGAGVVSPVTNQPGGKPLLDLSGGTSLVKDFLNSSGLGVYTNQSAKAMSNSSGNVDFFTISLPLYSGYSCHLRVNFSLTSGGGGTRQFYRESIIQANGSGTLTETNIHAISGANGSLSFALSGADITVRATSSAGSTEDALMGLQLLGYDMKSSRVSVL